MIRYDKKLNNEIQRSVRKFNAKVRRLQTKGYDSSLLPSTVTSSQLKATYNTRNDLKYRLRQLDKFGERGAEEIITTKGGAKTTKYQLDILKQNVSRAKRYFSKRVKTIESIHPTSFGKRSKFSFAQMGSEELTLARRKRESLNRNIMNLDPRQYDEFYRRTMHEVEVMETKKRVWFENFEKVFRDAAENHHMPKDKTDYIIKAVKKLNYDQFDKLQMQENSFDDVVNYYDKLMLMKPMEQGETKQSVESSFESLFNNLYETIDDLVEKIKEGR